ncbi:HlyD family efflux transporter periplasmic adaptor subunit [Pseudoalteromonas sp. BZK2]|uniref:HlyD family secretion protein n=1 Tax=Pseudoalteromonas sp. BZK2 TaxID=1904458 RepID=UPI0016547847|nr:HlyD family efflux transporter periplasmic adaptor subunit [Pseudoalteromonas sp. BZK2]MBC7010427.1 HlyD family efflux transporter periplasmic adaptor subunit [Pseudoalteromonas sp. BZK2]
MDSLFRKEVLEHKRHRLEGTVSIIQPPIFKRLTVLILAIVIVSFVFLSLGQYTRKERVIGVIEPDAGILRIEASQSGLISEVLVSEGQFVKAGATLVKIASAKHSSQKLELNQALLNQYQFQLSSLELQIKQQQAQDILDLEQLRLQKKSLEQSLSELDRQSTIFKERLALNKQMVEQVGTLKGTGFISELELQKQKDTLLSLQQQASSIKSERVSLASQLKQHEKQIKQRPLQQYSHIAQLESQKADLQMRLSSIEQQRLGELRAPKSGIVSGLTAKVGKTVSTGQMLMSVLPENSDMQAIVYVPTSAFGFVDVGQNVRIRYHSFPYEKFGVYDGTITEISSSVILPEEVDSQTILTEPAYRVVITLNDQAIQAYGKATPLRVGMNLDADIVIEKRSLLRWLFDPVFSIRGQFH